LCRLVRTRAYPVAGRAHRRVRLCARLHFGTQSLAGRHQSRDH
jgi:hypothetical protein